MRNCLSDWRENARSKDGGCTWWETKEIRFLVSVLFFHVTSSQSVEWMTGELINEWILREITHFTEMKCIHSVAQKRFQTFDWTQNNLRRLRFNTTKTDSSMSVTGKYGKAEFLSPHSRSHISTVLVWNVFLYSTKTCEPRRRSNEADFRLKYLVLSPGTRYNSVSLSSRLFK